MVVVLAEHPVVQGQQILVAAVAAEMERFQVYLALAAPAAQAS
jgi:hypothetical protein